MNVVITDLNEVVRESVERCVKGGYGCSQRHTWIVNLCRAHEQMHFNLSSRTDPARTEGLNDYQEDRP